MSQENVEFAQSVFSRWNAGERTFPDEEIHPDAVVVSPILGEAVRGRAGVRRYLREIDEQFDEWTMAIDEWRDAGDLVVALGNIRLHGRRSGVAFEQPVGILFEIRGGQLLRFEAFPGEPAGALQAAELSEEAMSQEKVEKLRRGYEAFSRGDFDSAIELAHPEIEFVRVGVDPPIRGVEAFRAWMEPDAIEDQQIEPLEFRTNDNKVLVRQITRGRGALSGIEMETETWAVWTVDENGLATHLEVFLVHQRDEARDAAGLSE